jgi:hypothetical protein
VVADGEIDLYRHNSVEVDLPSEPPLDPRRLADQGRATTRCDAPFGLQKRAG